ncbi:hemagglutinin repeat-containing protein, partial [Microvirga sp. W0021]
MALAHGTTINAGGNLSLNAGNDIHLQGANVHAGNDLSLVVGNDITIESAQSYSSSGSREEEWNAGIGVGATAGLGGWSAGIQIEGGYSRSNSNSWGIQQENSYISAGNSITIKSGNDTTLAGALVSAPDITLDVGNNLTVQSRQDTGHSGGSSARGGGSLTIGAGVAGSFYAGGGNSDSDVAWVTEQTGIYADKKLDIYVENHTQLDGSVLNSSTGDLTLDTGTLGFTTIKDYDKGDAFDMTVGGSAGGLQENAWSWNTAQNGGGSGNSSNQQSKKSDQKTGLPNGPWVGGSVSGHDREQDTNATVGEGTITIRNRDQQVQDVATLNRDLSQAQVITKDESYGVEFYASNSGLNAITNPAQYYKDVTEG